MHNFFNVYSISFKKVLKMPMFYGVMGLAIFVSLLILVVIPLSSFDGILSYYESAEWTHLAFAALISVFGILSAVIGELNAINNEKIYFLSKPIKRSTFLWAKCLASFTWSLIITAACSLILVVIALVEFFGWHETIFKLSHGNNPYSIFISFLIVCLFASFCSTIWTYILRKGYSMIVFAAIVVLYAILFPFFLDLDMSDFDDKSRLLWVTLPIGIYSFLLIVFGWIGARIFMKSEIES